MRFIGKAVILVSKSAAPEVSAEVVNALVSVIMRDDLEGRGNSLSEWVEWDMFTDYILPNIPADVEDKKLYAKTVFARVKAEVIKKVRAWEPDWEMLFSDD